jgi:hypothetical protein
VLAPLLASLSVIPTKGTRGVYMRKRPAIAVAITNLLVLMLWETGMSVTNAAPAGIETKADSTIPSCPNPYLPIKRLEPAY